MKRLALIPALALVACHGSKPLEHVGPLGIVVPASFKEDNALEQKVSEKTKAGPGASRISRLWRDESTKLNLSLTIGRLPHQPEWSQFGAREALNEIVNQAVNAGERAGLETIHGERHEEGHVLRYTLDSKMKQSSNAPLYTFNRAGIWLETDGSLVNATAVCTADDAHRDDCTKVLETLVFDAPAAARALDGGA